MICERCGERILDIEARKTIVPDSASGAKPAVTVHVRYCVPPPTQTAPIPNSWSPVR